MISIRDYKDSDFSELARIHDAARVKELKAANLLDAFLAFEQTYENEELFENRVSVACEGEQVRGFVAFSDLELAWLYVDPEHHRKGIGSALIAHALEHCAQDVKIEVLVGNDDARSVYEAAGFKVLRTWSGKMAGNESFPASAWIMQR